MKMTHALVAMLLFGILMWSGDYDTLGSQLLSFLNLDNPSAWTVVKLTGTGIFTGIVIWATGGDVISAPAIAIMVSLVSAPLGVFTADIPFVIKTILSGLWLFVAISGVGAAMRGDY